MNERTAEYYASCKPSEYTEEELADVLARCGPPPLTTSPSGLTYIRTTTQKEVPGMPESLKEARRVL